MNGNRLRWLAAGAFALSMGASPVAAAVDHVVISQIYGGGGSGAPVTYKTDYVELFNPTTQTVNLGGWSLQYGSATGTGWSVHSLPSTLSIAPGQYLLIAESSGTAGADLPLPADASGALTLSATTGKVALVSGTTALSGACPGTGVVDFVGFGGANCAETTPTPALTKQSGAVRKEAGCTDTDVNSADFDVVVDPVPRNGSSPVHACGSAAIGGRMRITEFMYQGTNGEFVEFTNVGDAAVDMAGWSYADSSRGPGHVALGAFGVVQPGESVILAEAEAGAFRTAWGLCSRVKVIGGNTVDNLGRADEINLYDATQAQVDRLTYGDNTPGVGGPRTNNTSAWPSAAVLGQNQITGWTLSIVGNAEGALASAGADVGSPGHSAHALVAYDPCAVDPNAPTVRADAATTSPYLDLVENVEGVASGVIGDPTDPAAIDGIGFAFDAPGGNAAALSISATSSNEAVVDAAGLQWSGGGAARVLRIVPRGVGYSVITVTATDAQQRSGSYVIRYAASAAAPVPATTHFLTGASDASATVAIDALHMIVADDETNFLRLYRRDRSGLPLAGFDFVAQLNLTDPANPEMDLEASARLGDRLFWTGSFSNSKNNHVRPNRHRVFATDLVGSGAAATLVYAGRYDWLLEDLVAWDHADGHGLGADALGLAASSAEGADSKTSAGFNIEGLSIAPDGRTAYFAFRAPQLPTNARHDALVVPVRDFDALITGAAPDSLPPGSARFDAPIFLDLGGRGIRSLDRNARGQYLVTAGAAGETGPAPNDFRLYAWTGQPGDAPIELGVDLGALGLAGGSFESIAELPDVLGRGSVLQFLLDNGDSAWYGDGVAAKDLPDPRLKKATSLLATVDVAFPAATVAATAGTPQSATVGAAFGAPLAVLVGDAYGQPVAGVVVAFEAPSSGAGAVLSSTTATTGNDGIARVDAAANTVAGGYAVTARVAGASGVATFSLTNAPGAAAAVAVASGTSQSVSVGQAFAAPLRVRVVDAHGNAAPGVAVTFSASASGASALLTSTTVFTGADGEAEVGASANTVAGAHVVTARVEGAAEAAMFSLTNLPGPAATIETVSGSPQSAIVGQAFAAPLRVRVVDAHGNALSGVAVTFAAPAGGATALLSSTGATTDADGSAGITASANAVAGSYTVQAAVDGVPVPTGFALTNLVDVDADRLFRDGFDPAP